MSDQLVVQLVRAAGGSAPLSLDIDQLLDGHRLEVPGMAGMMHRAHRQGHRCARNRQSPALAAADRLSPNSGLGLLFLVWSITRSITCLLTAPQGPLSDSPIAAKVEYGDPRWDTLRQRGTYRKMRRWSPKERSL